MRILLINLIFCLPTLIQAQSIIYVDIDATGLNDGSSWQDAYTDLKAALDNNFLGGEFWVAEGTYVPGNNLDQSFDIYGFQEVYGGFDGTEILRTARDVANNLTILSGDISGDDLNSPANDISDIVGINAKAVVRINGFGPTYQIVDGFTITGGSDFSLGWGGGLKIDDFSGSGTDVTVKNCHFQANAGNWGGAIGLNARGDTAKLRIENCEFTANYANTFGGGILFWPDGNVHLDAKVVSCQFTNNSARQEGGAFCKWVGWGFTTALNAITTDSTLIQDCVFRNNQTGQGLAASAGGAISMRYTRASGINQMRNNVIENNICGSTLTAANQVNYGGGISLLVLDMDDSVKLSISGSAIKNNHIDHTGDSNGGGIFVGSTLENHPLHPNNHLEVKIDSSSIQDNFFTANQSGGKLGGGMSLIITDGSGELNIVNSDFRNNSAQLGGALEFRTFSDNLLKTTFDNCVFERNSATQNGGAILSNGIASVRTTQRFWEMNDCLFQNNHAANGGGIWFDSRGSLLNESVLNMTGNFFQNNQSTSAAGALGIKGQGIDDYTINIQQDSFVSNQSDGLGGSIMIKQNSTTPSQINLETLSISASKANFGGGIYFEGGNSKHILSIANSILTKDSALAGGAINLNGDQSLIQLENLLISENRATVSGGGIYANMSGNTLTATGLTFAHNQAFSLGDAIYFQANGNSSNLKLENSILWNPNSPEDIFAANVATDISYTIADIQLPGTANLAGDPQFEDPSNHDYHLRWSSPAIDAGLDNLATLGLDLDGNLRIQSMGIDLGAYESPFTTSLESPVQSQLKFFPNPSQGQIQVELPELDRADVSVYLYDQLGRVVFEDRFAERSSSTLALDFGSLSPGVYLLKLQTKGQSFSESLIIH